MDARDLSQQIFKLWQDKYPKDTGSIHKSLVAIPVTIWTDQGYRQVVGASINQLGIIELQLDDQ